MNWVCDIPGASSAVSAAHFALQLGLAAFVFAGGTVFLVLSLIAYRRPAAETPSLGVGSDKAR